MNTYMADQREKRFQSTKPLRLSFENDRLRDTRGFLLINKSDRGLGGICFARGFPGRGTKVQCDDQTYILRWVKPIMGYVYRFGCEMAS
jgi:hypothetical protein